MSPDLGYLQPFELFRLAATANLGRFMSIHFMGYRGLPVLKSAADLLKTMGVKAIRQGG